MKNKKIVIILLLSLFFAIGMKGENRKPLVTFGVVTDVHYSNVNEMRINRYYKLSKEKLIEAVNTFNQHKVDFMVVLGDVIDGDLDSYADIKPVFASLKKPVYKVLGNHDFLDVYGSALEKRVQKELGIKRPYYSICKNGLRFVFLDSNDVALYSRSADSPEGKAAKELYKKLKRANKINAQAYNGTLGEKQLEWLSSVIDKAQKKNQMVVCFAHMPFLPCDVDACDFRGEALNELLRSHPNVKAMLTGHHHAGTKYLSGKVKYYGFRGMIEGRENHYSIVRIFDDGMEIEGFGGQENLYVPFDG